VQKEQKRTSSQLSNIAEGMAQIYRFLIRPCDTVSPAVIEQIKATNVREEFGVNKPKVTFRGFLRQPTRSEVHSALVWKWYSLAAMSSWQEVKIRNTRATFLIKEEWLSKDKFNIRE
jgi:hypothetical protein